MKFLSLVCPTVVLTVRSGYNNRHRSVMCTAHALALCTYSYVLLALRTVDGQDGTDRQCHVQRVTAVHGRNRCSKTLSQLLNQQGCQHGSRFSRDFRTGFVGVIGTLLPCLWRHTGCPTCPARKKWPRFRWMRRRKHRGTGRMP